MLAFLNVPATTKQRLNVSNPNVVALPPSLETGAKLDGTGFVDAMPPAALHQLGQLYARRHRLCRFGYHLAEALDEEEMSDHCSIS
jgi:hypothetical protein